MAIIVLVTLGACGTVSKEEGEGGTGEDTSSPDAQADMADGRIIDAAPSRCDPEADFVMIEPVEELNTSSSDESAFLTEDELTIYFSRQSGTNWDIWFATRPTRDVPFGEAQLVPGVNTSTAVERDPAISSDELFLYAATNGDLSVATRSDVDAEFGSFAPIGVLNLGAHQASPYVLPNGRIYFASGSFVNQLTIYTSTGAGLEFETPEAVAGIDIGPDGVSEGSPVLTRDELTMFFHSPRAGAVGEDDIWSTSRPSDESAFLPSVNERSLNEARFDNPNWISADGCVLYFSRDLGASGTITYDIYRAWRGL